MVLLTLKLQLTYSSNKGTTKTILVKTVVLSENYEILIQYGKGTMP